jgi:23S rRNA (uracil1939-C5)-methyltransferase
MLARHDGLVILIAGAIPGERIRARIERVSRQVAYADTVEVLQADADRREAAVDWACGGSLYSHINYPRQQALKAELIADAFARIAKLPLPCAVAITASKERGYRMRARLHARNGRLGFFREGTHELCEAGPTGQLLPATIEAIDGFRTALGGELLHDIAACDIAENIPADERAILIETRGSTTAWDCVAQIEGMTGLMVQGREEARARVIHGSPYVMDVLPIPGASASVRLRHHVRAFFQGNRWLLAPLVEHVVAQVPEDDVLELYAGVGLFAMSLAAVGRTGIVAVEGDRISAADLDANAEPHRDVLEVRQISVERYLQHARHIQRSTVLLDPPRTGISREAMSGLLALKAPRVVYVSCDVATLARDVRRFVDDGYDLHHIEAFDLFPNTAHVETLVTLTLT